MAVCCRDPGEPNTEEEPSMTELTSCWTVFGAGILIGFAAAVLLRTFTG